MGEFIAASGVVGADATSVQQALADILVATGDVETFDDEELTVEDLTYAAGPRGVTVMYPGMFTGYSDVSRQLSSVLSVPVFAFHIHDGDLWMYEFFAAGELVDRFNPWPRYWNRKVKQGELEKWAGNADALIAHLPGIDRRAIENYLASWEDETGTPIRRGKAYAEDRFTYGSSWQLLDFMSSLGLVLPDPPPEKEPDPTRAAALDQYSRDAQLRYLRNQAERAWQAKNYREVAETYASLDDLSELERRKLDYSRKKLYESSAKPSPGLSSESQREQVRRPWWKLW